MECESKRKRGYGIWNCKEGRGRVYGCGIRVKAIWISEEEGAMKRDIDLGKR